MDFFSIIALFGGLVVRVHGDARQARIPLGPDAHALELRAVDDHVAGIVFFRSGVLQHGLPLIRIHYYVNAYDLIGVEELGLILHGNSHTAHSLNQLVGKAHGQKADDDCNCHDRNYYF